MNDDGMGNLIKIPAIYIDENDGKILSKSIAMEGQLPIL